MQLTFTPHHFSNWWQEWKWSFTGPQTGAHRAATRFTGAEILKYSRLRWSCSACQGKEGIGLRSTVSKLAKSNLRSKDIKSFTIPRPLWSSVVLIRPAGPQVSKSPSKQWSSAQAPGQETAKVSQPTPSRRPIIDHLSFKGCFLAIAIHYGKRQSDNWVGSHSATLKFHWFCSGLLKLWSFASQTPRQFRSQPPLTKSSKATGLAKHSAPVKPLTHHITPNKAGPSKADMLSLLIHFPT